MTGHFMLLLGTEYGMLAGASLWLKVGFPRLRYGSRGIHAITTSWFTEAGKASSDADEESAETNRMMGLAALQARANWTSLRPLPEVPMGDAVMDNLWPTWRWILSANGSSTRPRPSTSTWPPGTRDYKDLQSKLNRAPKSVRDCDPGRRRCSPRWNRSIGRRAVEKPMLGRYRWKRSSAKAPWGGLPRQGSENRSRGGHQDHGAVPKVRRRKNLPMRVSGSSGEAETAGRLQHQNIVTIFDAGEETKPPTRHGVPQGQDLRDHSQGRQSVAHPGRCSIWPAWLRPLACASAERGAP